MNESNQITDTHLTTHVRTHTSTSHDSSNHPHPRPVDPPSSSLVHESRLVKSPPSVSSSLCRRLDVARVDRSRRARASPSSSSSSTASASASRERTNTRMKIYTSRRRPALERVDVDRERTRAQRSDDPPTLDRRFARSTRRPEGPNRRSIGPTRIARDASDARENSMRTNRRDRTNEWVRSIESSRRLANASRSNDARDGTRACMREWTRAAPRVMGRAVYIISATHGIDAIDEARPHYGRGGGVCRLSSFCVFFCNPIRTRDTYITIIKMEEYPHGSWGRTTRGWARGDRPDGMMPHRATRGRGRARVRRRRGRASGDGGDGG